MNVDSVLERIAKVEAALLNNDPNMKLYLQQIHKQILAEPELAFILPPEKVGIFVQGMCAQAKVEVTPIINKEKKSARGLKGTTLEDLM